ncbi:MAG: nucleoside hydrolase [Pseudomonadales bacterium]
MSADQPAIPLLIDTDVALGIEHEGRPRDIDDGFAMVEAINCPDLELLGVTTVYGNAPHLDVHRVANDILELKQATVPLAPGATEPLPQQGPLPPPNEAVEFLAETLRARPAHLVAIGPLTNIALLAHHHPDVLDRVLSIIAVAGRSEDAAFYLGETGPVRDFNFENDVRAAQMVLEAGVPVVLAGFELTSQVSVTEHDLQAIRRSGTATAEYFYGNSLAWCRYWTRTFPVDGGFHPWDSAAIAWLRHPEYFVTQPRGWRIRQAPVEEAAETRAGRNAKPGSSFWLECDPAYPGSSVTYCSGFAPGGKEAFVRDVVTTVY